MGRFLVIDDDPACRRLVENCLRPFGQCDLAQDGHEGLAAFRRALDRGQPYDLVCLDIMMPGIDGHDVLDSLRNTDDTSRDWRPRRQKVVRELCEKKKWGQETKKHTYTKITETRFKRNPWPREEEDLCS